MRRRSAVAAVALVAAATLAGLRLAHAAPFERPALSGQALARVVAEARFARKQLGDLSVKTAEVFGPARERVAEAAAWSASLPNRSSLWGRSGYYVIALHGRFRSCWCEGGPPGAKPPRGTLELLVWRPGDDPYFAGRELTTGELPSKLPPLAGPKTLRLG